MLKTRIYKNDLEDAAFQIYIRENRLIVILKFDESLNFFMLHFETLLHSSLDSISNKDYLFTILYLFIM